MLEFRVRGVFRAMDLVPDLSHQFRACRWAEPTSDSREERRDVCDSSSILKITETAFL